MGNRTLKNISFHYFLITHQNQVMQVIIPSGIQSVLRTVSPGGQVCLVNSGCNWGLGVEDECAQHLGYGVKNGGQAKLRWLCYL